MKIIHQRSKCIGCGNCVALCPQYWEIADDGLAQLKDSKINSATNDYELEVVDADCNEQAVESCPVKIIHFEE